MRIRYFTLAILALLLTAGMATLASAGDCIGCAQTYSPYTNHYYGEESYGYYGWDFYRVHYNDRIPYYRHYYPYHWHYPYAYSYYPGPMYQTYPWGYGPGIIW